MCFLPMCEFGKTAERIIRNVRNSIKRTPVNIKLMIPGRVEKLLKCGNYPGLTSDVLQEAPCFQLGEDGEVDRHVFLAVTRTEFVMATQTLPDYVKFPSVKYRANVDLDLDGMEVVCSSPLEFVRFFMMDASSRRFAVCTCLGHVWYFEMCNAADGSDDLWTKWREMIAEQDNILSYGYKTWKVKKDDVLDARKTVFPIEIEGELGCLNFIKRPLNFCPVDDVGIQYSLSSLETGRTRILETRNRRSHSAGDSSTVNIKSTDQTLTQLANSNAAYLLKPSFHEAQIQLPSNLKNLRFHPLISSSATDLTKREEADVTSQGHPVRRSRSDCVLGMSCSAFAPRTSLHYKFSIIAFIGEALPEEPHRAVDIVAIRFPKWGLGRTSLNQLHKIWKLRNEERLTKERDSQLHLSDSDESITDIFEEFSKAKKRMSPAARWKALRGKIGDKKPTLADIMKTVAFEKCDMNKYKEKLWLFGATPADMAAQLTQINIDMFKKLTELDIINYLDKYCQGLPSITHEMLAFSRGVSLLVTREILASTTQTQMTKRVKFFIQVCETCRKSCDLQSTWSVLTGLQLLPVSRLKDTWSAICREFPDVIRDYKNICYIFSHLSSRKYKEELQNSTQRCPYLPWLNHLLWHIKRALQRRIEHSKSKVKVTSTTKQVHLGVVKFLGKKVSFLGVPGKLTQTISKHRQNNLRGGSWMTLHRESYSKCGLGSNALHQEDIPETGIPQTSGLPAVCPEIRNMAERLSSQIIKRALDEHCHTSAFNAQVLTPVAVTQTSMKDIKTPKSKKGTKKPKTAKKTKVAKTHDRSQTSKRNHAIPDARTKEVLIAKTDETSHTSKRDRLPPGAETKDDQIVKDLKLEKPVNDAMPVIQVVSCTSINEQEISTLIVESNRGTGSDIVEPSTGHTDRKQVADDKDPTLERETQDTLLDSSFSSTGVEQRQISIPKRSGNTKLSSPKQDGSRRKSLFEAASENEESMHLKETAIDDAIQAQLKQTKSGSIFEVWSEEEEAVQPESSQLEVVADPQRKTSFLGSLFERFQSSKSNIETQERNKPKSVRFQSIPAPYTEAEDENSNSSSYLYQEMEMNRRHSSVLTEIQVSNSSKDSENMDVDSPLPDENRNCSGSSQPRASNRRHLLSLSMTQAANSSQNLQSKYVPDENRNWSSSSRQRAVGRRCSVCNRTGCILASCGLEKLVELQLACLSYHMKSNSKLYKYIQEQSQNLSLVEILRTHGNK